MPTSSKAKKVTRLQTLWGHFFTHRILPFEKAAKPSAEYRRQLRLGWVAGKLGLEELASFNDLNWEQLDKAIDALQKELPADLVKRKRPSREQAKRYGVEGRRSNGKGLTGPADGPSLELLGLLRQKAGLTDQARFEALLRSRSSPTRGRTRLMTQADVNRVIWMLKGMLRRAENSASTTANKNLQHEEVPA